MPATVSHALSATTPDDPAYEIRPSHWNDTHGVTLSVAATEISALFSNANGVSWGLDGTNITASVGAAGGGLTNINVSAGTTSNNLSALTFGNANGVSFGLNGSVVTGSHNAITTGRASTDALGLATAASNVTWTANSAGVSIDARGYAGTATTFNGANVSGSMTLNSAGLNLSLSAAAPGGGANVNISAGTTSNNLTALTFSDANGLAFGLNGSVITGSYTQSTHSHSTGPGALAAGTQTGTSGTFVFANSNDFTFGMSGSSQITASFSQSTHSHQPAVGLNTAQSNVTWTVNSSGISLDARGYAGTGTTFAGANLSGSITQNSNGLNLSLSAAAGGAGPTLSYFANLPFFVAGQTLAFNQSTSRVEQFNLPNNLSFGFLRMLASCAVGASSTAATTGGTSFGGGFNRSHNFVIYSRGVGASSMSLQSVYSSQVTDQVRWTISNAANSTQHSYSLRYTLPVSSGTIGFTKDYSSSAASLNFHTSHITDLTGQKQVDFNIATSLAPGQYWVAYGVSTTQTTARTADESRWGVQATSYGQSIFNVALGTWGSAAVASVHPYPGMGSFSTAGGGTTASIPMSAISSSGSHNVLFFQLMRIA